MLGLYNETKDIMKFRFEGEDSIDINELIHFLDKTLNVFNEMVSVVDRDVFLKLEVKAMEKGSFLCQIAFTLLQDAPKLFPYIKSVKELTGAFTEIINIKTWLKGEKIKEVKQGEIISVSGVAKDIVYKPTYYIFSNVDNLKKIDGKLIEFSENMPNRKLFIEDGKEQLTIESATKEILRKPIIEEQVDSNNSINEKEIVEKYLIVKKPDFSMKSMWEFISDIKIKAQIFDEEFKESVLSGKFKTYHGHRIKVKLEIENEYTPDYEIISSHYKILKVLEY